MSKIDEYCEIRLATEDDIENIMLFIKTEWSENHILANDRDFFEYEYCYRGRVNAEIAIDRETGKIVAFQGFICYADTDVHEKIYVAGALMKATGKIPFTGVETQKRLLSECFVKDFIGNGLNTKTSYVLAQKVFKRKTGKLKHYYMLSETKGYIIAEINNKIMLPIENSVQYGLVLFNSGELALGSLTKNLLELETNPYGKDEWYITRRYFQHPIYEYKIFGIAKDEKIIGYVVGREQTQYEHKILRIVDFLADREDISHLGKAFRKLISEEDYEYVDMYLYGIEDKYMIQAGFNRIEENDKNIIPNYFEPYVRQNIDIYWESPLEHPIMFKADGDQDRPSRR